MKTGLRIRILEGRTVDGRTEYEFPASPSLPHERIVIGRAPGHCGIVFVDDLRHHGLAEEHMAFQRSLGRYLLDVNFRNAVLVDGRRVFEEQELRGTHELQLGDSVRLEVTVVEESLCYAPPCAIPRSRGLFADVGAFFRSVYAARVRSPSAPPRPAQACPQIPTNPEPTAAGQADFGDFEESAAGDVVKCTAFAPASVQGHGPFLVQVAAHLHDAAEEISALAMECDSSTGRRGTTSLGTRIQRGTRLAFRLSGTGFQVDEQSQAVTWRGHSEFVQFLVTPVSSQGTLGLAVSVLQGDVPIGAIKFVVSIDPTTADALPQACSEAIRYRSAFASYASPDRGEVLRRVQMLRAAGIRCFQDVLDLEPGDRWERRLWQRIDEADVLFLFWSCHARDSEWVSREWQYGLQRKGLDFIRPVILEHPSAPPPPELAALHFDDMIPRCLT
ncbi:MAG: TIR domain-containing protein [Cyanobium sp.]